MWRRPTESGISFICILAPTRFFVKSIKINIARRGLKIPSPASFFSPLSSFWPAKNSLLFLYHRLRQTRLLEKKNVPRGAHFFIFSRNLISSEAMKAHSANSGLPRAENLFARKFLQPAFEFLTGKNSHQFLPHRLRQTSLLEKKNAPRGAHFLNFQETLFLSQQAKHILA